MRAFTTRLEGICTECKAFLPQHPNSPNTYCKHVQTCPLHNVTYCDIYQTCRQCILGTPPPATCPTCHRQRMQCLDCGTVSDLRPSTAA